MDQGSVDEWAALYTEDGEFVQEGSDPVTGTEALRAFMAAQPVGVVHHILANHTIEVSDDDATSVASVIVISKGAIVASGAPTTSSVASRAGGGSDDDSSHRTRNELASGES